MKRGFSVLISVLLVASCATMRPAASGAGAAAVTVSGTAGRPLIGISCGGSATMTTLKTTYSDAVRLAGGVPVLIPILRDSATVSQLVERLDGVILSGGEDIDPLYYGEEPLPGLGEINAPRDTFDVLLIRTALRQCKPLLGICRGEQVLNVVLGGTLWQDIPSQIPESQLHHRQEEPSTVATQTITIDPSSRLAEILGVSEIAVNSHHHQAVKDLAPGLIVTARTEDGVVEAYESLPDLNVEKILSSGTPAGADRFREQGAWILAVQFHPETFTQAGDPTFLKIFQDLVRRAAPQRPVR